MAEAPPNPLIAYGALMKIALPSILLESAPAGAQIIQTALLGQKATGYVAAWAVVSGTTNSATSIFNFLVLGVTAKVGRCVGAKAWDLVGSRIRLALCCSIVLGIISSALLYLLKEPVFRLLEDSPDVRGPAEDFYFLKCIGISVQLFAYSTTGILQGYKRVNLVATINICRVAVDVLGSYIALYVVDSGMWGIGVSNVVAATITALAALGFVILLPPQESNGKIKIFPRFDSWPFFRFNYKGSNGEEFEDSFATHLLLDNKDRFPSLWKEGSATNEQLLNKICLPVMDQEEIEERNKLQNEGFWKFLFDGLSFVVRNTFIQLSFFLVLLAASRLSVAALAAHQIIRNLWTVCIYVIDGFATAATIVGSDISGKLAVTKRKQEEDSLLRDLKILTWRSLKMGLFAGSALAVLYLAFEDSIAGAFTDDPLVRIELKRVWLFVSIIQPFNALVFIYDGLILAAQAFFFYAVVVVSGFFTVFLPCMFVAQSHTKTLEAAWMAKVALNAVRLIGAAFYTHNYYLKSRKPPQERLLNSSTESKSKP